MFGTGRAIGRLEASVDALQRGADAGRNEQRDLERRLTGLEAFQSTHLEHHVASGAEERHQRQARENMQRTVWLIGGTVIGVVLHIAARTVGWL